MNEEVVLLDVNIIMYAAGQEHPYREDCIRVIRGVAEGKLEAAIDTETIQEILYRYGALRRLNVAVRMARNSLDLVDTVLPVQSVDARLAVVLFERYSAQGVTARDVVHAAVMLNNGLRQIVSVDRHFDLIEGIERVDPVSFYP